MSLIKEWAAFLSFVVILGTAATLTQAGYRDIDLAWRFVLWSIVVVLSARKVVTWLESQKSKSDRLH